MSVSIRQRERTGADKKLTLQIFGNALEGREDD
jgi:hypothetical protein